MNRFQSTHPVWDATQAQDTQAWLDANFNPRIPYGMRQGHVLGVELQPVISIHASRMGCDRADGRPVGRTHHFNPRIPYGMRRLVTRPVDASYLFQSTHPVWDATRRPRSTRPPRPYFNPRIPYGMRLAAHVDLRRVAVISIHASRMGCDFHNMQCWRTSCDFNPRIPYGMRQQRRYHHRFN